MTLREAVWGAGVAASRPLLPAARLLGPKAARVAAGRRRAAPALEEEAEDLAGSGRPVVWLHGASAGELLGAAPVAERLRSLRPHRLLVTYTSPSAESALGALSPRASGYLPLDTLGACRRVLRAASPSLLLFAKGDLWPNLTRAAAAWRVPVAIVNATVRPDSSRLRWPARALLSPAYGRVAAAGAATEGDAARLVRLGAPEDAVRVTGDAALDLALRRARRGRDGPAARRLRAAFPDGRPLLVAGSTWLPDERALLRAAGRLEAEGRGGAPALALVPHEPGPEAVERVRSLCRRELGRAPRLWSEMGDGGGSGAAAAAETPVVVDAVGVLAELYTAADLAWVGGGLGGDGLHSVSEPAAAGVPVLFGPRHRRWEAEGLLREGGAGTAGPGETAELISALLADPSRREEMGRAARRFVEARSGGSEGGAELAAGLLEGGPG